MNCDVAFCQHKTCRKRKTCYRFLSKPDICESAINFMQICKKKNNYQWYIKHYILEDKKSNQL